MAGRPNYPSLVAGILIFAAIPARAGAGERDDVLKFLKDNVIGRTLEHRSTSKIAEGRIETEFTRRTTFTGLVETPSGLAFDEVIDIKQVLHDLDGQGKRTSPGRNNDRVLVLRHEYSIRESTGHLIGISRVPLNSFQDSTGVANSERIASKGDSLVIQRLGIGYGDFFAPGGKFEPATSDAREEFEVREGKLRRVTRTMSYRVDPETLNRLGKKGEDFDLIDEESPSSKSK